MRELRQNASRYLDRVKAGDIVEVTERGELVAIITGPRPGSVGRERMVRGGRLLPALTEFTLPRRVTIPLGGHSTANTLADLRSDRSE